MGDLPEELSLVPSEGSIDLYQENELYQASS